jgi:hypothetical protein
VSGSAVSGRFLAAYGQDDDREVCTLGRGGPAWVRAAPGWEFMLGAVLVMLSRRGSHGACR